MSGSASPRALSNWQRFAYSVGNFGVGLLPSIAGSWAMYYYAPPVEEGSCLMAFVPMSLIGLMLGAGRVAEALLNPFIGDWSDKTRSRWGRRMPYIRFGTPLLVLAAIMIWFPPIKGESYLNAAWVCFWMCIMSMSFAAVVAPYLSLLPELTPHNDERLTVSAWMAVFEILGTLVATAGAGFLIDAYKCGVPPFGAQEFNGFQLAGIVFGLVSLAAFLITGFVIKEKEHSAAKEVTLPFMTGVREVWKNKAFFPYLGLVTTFRIGIDTVVVAIPYMVSVVMGGTEGDAVFVQLEVILGSILLFPVVNWLSVKYGKKLITLIGCVCFVVLLPLMMTIGMVPGISPMLYGYLVFALAIPPIAVFNVTPRPLIADIIDADEKVTGFRREAIYNGMEGLFSRSASGFAWVLCSLLFAFFGNTPENHLGILIVGPVGGFFVLIGSLLFRKYPIKD